MKLLTNRRTCIFSMNHMANEDKDFLLRLPKNLRDEYKAKRADLINENNTKWSADHHVIKKREGIKLDKDHNEILNACIFPFVQHSNIIQKLGYAYIKSSPLSELGVKNVDFLIASQTDDVLIFGEAKGKITDPRTVITQYKERIKIIEENSAYITEKFSGMKTFEYVLGVPSGKSLETAKAIRRSNTNIILWYMDMWHDVKLSMAILPTENAAERRKGMHSNDDLNRTLSKGVPTSTAFKTFYHESHPVAKMTVLTSIDKSSENFTFDDLQTCVSEELDNTPDNEITTITEQIMNCAIDIGFVKHLGDKTYKIQSRFKHSGARYQELKTKWITQKIETEKEYDFNQKLEQLRAKFLAQHKPLDNYYKHNHES